MRKAINIVAMIVIGLLAIFGIWAVSPFGTLATWIVSILAVALIQLWNILEEQYTASLRNEYEQACIERKTIGVMNRTEHEKELLTVQQKYNKLKDEYSTLLYDFASQIQATDEAEARYSILADKWRELNSKYATVLSEQKNGVVVTNTSKGTHEVIEENVPYADVIKQCEKCGADMDKKKVYWVCPECKARKKI